MRWLKTGDSKMSKPATLPKLLAKAHESQKN